MSPAAHRILLLSSLALLLVYGGDPSELSDHTICDALGYADLTPFRHGLPLTSPYGATNSSPIFMPFYSSEPLLDSTATTAVVFIHGLSGDANTYFCEGMVASAAHPDALIIAPWFGNEASSGDYWNDVSGALGETVFWSNSRWSTGGTNTAPPKSWTTSFDQMDALLRALPKSVTLISVVGFSAGAQLTARYAFGTPLGSPEDDFSPHVRFFAGNPGSYLFFSEERPTASCSPLYDTGSDHNCDSFEIPASSCPGFDDYKYGLQNIGYLNLYLAPLESNATARELAVARFATKDFRLFLGTEDVCNCNAEGYVLPQNGECAPDGGKLTCSPDAFGGPGCCDTYPDALRTNSLDHSCSGMLQGSNRLQRGLNYASYLQLHFSGYSPHIFLDAYAHNNSGMYMSAAFQSTAYKL